MNRSKQIILFLIVATTSLLALNAAAHGDKPSKGASATYLGNEGVLIAAGDAKVLFDPFFHNDYGSYQLVPEDIRTAIFDGKAPYDDISLIIISHAHGDHFSAEDALTYLQKNTATKLVAPKQAISLVLALEGSEGVASQLVAIELNVGDVPKVQNISAISGAIKVESVRIPHAGWPSRKDVSNLVHRVSFQDNYTVLHMGDADPNDIHFKPYSDYWLATKSSLAFPPYWFYTNEQGKMILSDRINTIKSVGVHVPIEVPSDLIDSGSDYFSMPGEVRDIAP